MNSKILHGLMMLRNHRTKKHIVVFESDDWGSIRMPSVEALHRLQNKNVPFRTIGLLYDKVDTLASNQDLEQLMEVCLSVKDSKGNPAKITLNCVTANPDFDRIQESGYQNYYFETFTATLKKYPHHDRAFELWKEGIRNNVFMPQFHGREHLNVPKWMRYLQSGNADALASFQERTFSMAINDSGSLQTVLPAYDIPSEKDALYIRDSIKEGLLLFETIFGFKSKTMIAPCYTWDSFVEDAAWEYGVVGFQGSYIQRHSSCEREKGNRITGHYFGERNVNGQVYIVRNCSFEPSQNPRSTSDSCMQEISKAFLQRVPAVISCHRLNFIGEKDIKNRENNLREFGKLLKMIVSKYPDVEFLSSDELIEELYQNENCNI